MKVHPLLTYPSKDEVVRASIFQGGRHLRIDSRIMLFRPIFLLRCPIQQTHAHELIASVLFLNVVVLLKGLWNPEWGFEEHIIQLAQLN